MNNAWSPYRFLILLISIVVLLLLTPFLSMISPAGHPYLARVLLLAAFMVMLLAAIYAVSRSSPAFLFSGILAGVIFGLRIAQIWFRSDGLLIAHHLLSIVFLAITIVLILSYLFRSQQVTLNTIHASLCVYLFLGILWALVYSLLATLDPGQFFSSLPLSEGGDTLCFEGERAILPLYFSFVTMTTLGYGDIIPAASPARMLAAMQAFTGQLYLAVMVARLVGLYVAQSMNPPQDEAD